MVLAAWPLAVLLLLAAGGWLAWPAAGLGAVAVAAGAALLATLWVRDLARTIWALHRAEAGAGEGAGPFSGPPLLSATAHIARAAARLSESLARREAELRTREAEQQDLVHRLPDPVVVLDAARQVHRTNAAAQTALSSGIGAVLRHPGLRAALDRAAATGTEQVADLHLAVPVGRELSVTAIPLAPARSDGARFVLVVTDRTRERAVERMRADFVANASHELRTPLTSVIGFIETLRGPAADDPPAQARFLGIMAEQAERMNRLIDDLLSLSRIELGEHQVPADRVDVSALLNRAASAFEPQLAARRVRLDQVADPALPALTGDEDQLDQVLHNLLDNAIKYGREGGTVRLSAVVPPPGGRVPTRPGLCVSVADDGPGVARAHLPRLTERFYRADKHRSRAVGGTGLGLAIVKHIVNRHRGQLWIDSVEGQGTVVTVWLPAGPAPPAGTAAAGTA